MQQQRPSGAPRVAQGVQQEVGVGDRLAVVGEGDHARVGQFAHLGQLFALEALADRTDLADPHHRLLRRPGRAPRRPPGPSRPPDRCWPWPPPSRSHRRPRPATRRPGPPCIRSPGVRRCACGVDEAREHPAAGEVVEDLHAGRPRQRLSPMAAMRAVLDQQVAHHVDPMPGSKRCTPGRRKRSGGNARQASLGAEGRGLVSIHLPFGLTGLV